MKKIKYSGKFMGEIFRLYLGAILFIEGIILIAVYLIFKHFFNIDLGNGFSIPVEYKKLAGICLLISWIIVMCKNHKSRKK